MKRLVRWGRRFAFAIVLVWATLVVGAAFDARSRLPDLKPWHRLVPKAELKAVDLGETATLADYLKREDETLAETRREIGARLTPADRVVSNRYFDESPLNPERAAKNWNRTFELIPETIRGGVLLVHGLTDAPYSVRAIAEIYRANGFYALALRMPGHGTVPGALTDVTWEDWLAAVRLGARHVRSRIGERAPLHFVGYSNGGALVLLHALAALDDPKLPKAERLVLVSPMIGVTPYAALGRTVSRLGVFPYFEKSKWTDVLPEYNPYKYNSFPANAGWQTWKLTSRLEAQLEHLAERGRAGELPKILTFQSVVDATVSTSAVVDRLYSPLAREGSELVLFDVNRTSTLRPFLKPGSEALLSRVVGNTGRKYVLTVVMNASSGTNEVAAKSYPPGAADPIASPLGLSWPADVYSLSHIALPFRPDDPIFGFEPADGEPRGIHLGLLVPRGEKSTLVVPEEVLMRISSNPFFAYVESRIREAIQPAS
ncbi:MAG: alpha/beta hydrolase [Thermoanaerobaculia bacterium]